MDNRGESRSVPNDRAKEFRKRSIKENGPPAPASLGECRGTIEEGLQRDIDRLPVRELKDRTKLVMDYIQASNLSRGEKDQLNKRYQAVHRAFGPAYFLPHHFSFGADTMFRNAVRRLFADARTTLDPQEDTVADPSSSQARGLGIGSAQDTLETELRMDVSRLKHPSDNQRPVEARYKRLKNEIERASVFVRRHTRLLAEIGNDSPTCSKMFLQILQDQQKVNTEMSLKNVNTVEQSFASYRNVARDLATHIETFKLYGELIHTDFLTGYFSEAFYNQWKDNQLPAYSAPLPSYAEIQAQLNS